MRVAIGSGPKAEKSGDTTIPAFNAPSTAMYSSGMRGSSRNRRSPRLSPSPTSALAKQLVSIDSPA
jgi:hypothetical protein